MTLEPWREEAHRQLMLRLMRSGQRAAALAQFETCRWILAEELRVEPDIDTLAVVGAIRTSDQQPPVPVDYSHADWGHGEMGLARIAALRGDYQRAVILCVK